MWVCPVCGKRNEKDLLCAGCGFDLSLHYRGYRTLAAVDAGRGPAASLYQAEREPDWGRLPWDPEKLEKLACYARKGFPAAQYELGRFYENGFGFSAQEMRKRGDFWLKKAAEQGYPGSAVGMRGPGPDVFGNGPESGLRCKMRVVAAGGIPESGCRGLDREDVTAVSAGWQYGIALKRDGTVITFGDNDWKLRTADLREIQAVSAGCEDGYTAALKRDGTVLLLYHSDKPRTFEWRGIRAIDCGEAYTVGLKADGTVVTDGDNSAGQCRVSGWRHIKAVSAGDCHAVGLREDGSVAAAGEDLFGQCDTSSWKDIVAVSAGSCHTVGLRKDGSVVAVGENVDGQCDVAGWRGIKAISAGSYHTVGLRRDGRVVAVGNNEDGQCDVAGWRGITAVSAGGTCTLGLQRVWDIAEE